MENKLVSAFKFFDQKGTGKIEQDDLIAICKQLDPDTWNDEKVNNVLNTFDREKTGFIDYNEFSVWMTGGMLDAARVMDMYEVAAAKMPGDRLADGDTTDAGLDKIRSYLNNALDITPEMYATPKATTKLSWLRDIATLLDPTENPNGFRICQNALVERGAIGPLLGLAQKAQSDGVMIKSLEVLARTAFSNLEAASAVVQHADFFPMLNSVLTHGKQPAKLTALQLAQAVAASSRAPEVQAMLPKLLAEVAPLLNEKSFMVLPRAAVDVFISISFGAPAAIVEATSWSQITNWLAESIEAGRPSWLHQDNLTVLACGFLAVNVLALPTSPTAGEDELQARKQMRDGLCNSGFLEFFVLAAEAAVMQQEWPAFSGAFHSVNRLASIVPTLAELGFARKLVRLVAPLAKAVEISPDEHTTCLALLALRRLVEDLGCLEEFLTLAEFRVETLEVLHMSGDEPEATDLVSCITAGEDALAAAQQTFEHSKKDLRNPPSVQFLAELFNEHVPMDGEITKSQLLQILPRVPIGPANVVEGALSGSRFRSCQFSFADFAQNVYGTPTLLGWWPSLMEDTDAVWNQPTFQALQPPSLIDVLHYYELGAKGTSGVTSDVILHEVLPAWQQPVEGELVEDLFAEIRGDTPLSFKEFGVWMCRYFQAVELEKQQKKSAENANGDL